MGLKKPTLLYIFILFGITFNDAIALSCAPMKDRVIAQCKELTCDKIFFVSEIKSLGKCGRRPTIIDPTPKWAKSIMEYEINTRSMSKEQGVYELVISKRLFNNQFNFSDTKEYIKAVENKDIPNKYFPKFRKLKNNELKKIRKDWEIKEHNKFSSLILWIVIEWISLIIPSICLIFSILWFNQWIHGIKTIKWLLIAICIQTIIISSFVMSVTGILYSKFIILGILIPGIWINQIIVYLSKVFEK